MISSAKIFLLALSLIMLATACKQERKTVAYGDLEYRDDVFFFEGEPFTGIAKEQHPNGLPKSEYPFSEGRLHGVVREWNDNGMPSVETEFDHGKRHGKNRYWNKEGRLFKEQIYEHDKSVSIKHFD